MALALVLTLPLVALAAVGCAGLGPVVIGISEHPPRGATAGGSSPRFRVTPAPQPTRRRFRWIYSAGIFPA